MSNSTPEEQKKLWLELALQKKRFLEEEGQRHVIISALSSRVPVLIFSQPKRAEILMLKGKKKKKRLSQSFQNKLLDQFLADQQKKLLNENELEAEKNNKALQKPKFLEMHLHLKSRNH